MLLNHLSVAIGKTRGDDRTEVSVLGKISSASADLGRRTVKQVTSAMVNT